MIVNSALILAGGGAPPELTEATGQIERALIPVGSSPMLAHVISALLETRGIERVAVVGSPEVLEAAAQEAHVIAVPAGERMVDNLKAGVLALQGKGHGDGGVLVCTCDIPLIHRETIEKLLDGATARELDIAYPIVRRATCEAAFPGGQRTYARLGDGEFTGGNAVVFPARILGDIVSLVDTAYNARKNPAALARMLGVGLMLKFATRRLTIADVEKRAGQILKCAAGAVEMRDATIAFDVDKAADLTVVREKLEKPPIR